MKSWTLCSYNTQAGIGTVQMPHYLTRLHGQFFDSLAKRQRLKAIGKAVAEYDIVCLQEVDLGGRRSGFSNQLDIIRETSGHEYFALQENRQVGKISRHGNATLSRYPILQTHDHKLPGRFSGRGALVVEIAIDSHFTVINAHLSLGVRDQAAQLSSLDEYLEQCSKTILAGDLNITSFSPHLTEFANNYKLQGTWNKRLRTYPSWNPRKSIDHILFTPDIKVKSFSVSDARLSDHRPIKAEFQI